MQHSIPLHRPRPFEVATLRHLAIAGIVAGTVCGGAILGAAFGTFARAALAPSVAAAAGAPAPTARPAGIIAGSLVHPAVSASAAFTATAYVHAVDRSTAVLFIGGTSAVVSLLGVPIHGLPVGATDLSLIEGALVRIEGSCAGNAGCAIATIRVFRWIGSNPESIDAVSPQRLIPAAPVPAAAA